MLTAAVFGFKYFIFVTQTSVQFDSAISEHIASGAALDPKTFLASFGEGSRDAVTDFISCLVVGAALSNVSGILLDSFYNPYFMGLDSKVSILIFYSINSFQYFVNNGVCYLKRIVGLTNLLFRKLFNTGFQYLKSLGLIFVVDSLLTDDEPLWEPVEWSLIQYWLIFIYLFAWIAENLITSRYGSYTDRDKRVWFAWYKTFWFVEAYYAISLGAAASFVIVPFYYELTYVTPFIASWWDWYSTTFFFKFTIIYTLVLTLNTYLQISLTQFHWKKSLVIICMINIFLAYLLYIQFFITFFAYFTDANWYAKARLVDYVQLSLEPNKWAWGNTKRDHFSYHSSKTVFWFKNDGPFASAMLFFNILFFLSLFTVHVYWLTLLRKVLTTREVTYTYTTFCISALRQFLYFFNLIYVLVFLSLLLTYWRLPCEFYWVFTSESLNVTEILTSLFN